MSAEPGTSSARPKANPLRPLRPRRTLKAPARPLCTSTLPATEPSAVVSAARSWSPAGAGAVVRRRGEVVEDQAVDGRVAPDLFALGGQRARGQGLVAGGPPLAEPVGPVQGRGSLSGEGVQGQVVLFRDRQCGPCTLLAPRWPPYQARLAFAGMGEIVDFESPVLRIAHDEAEGGGHPVAGPARGPQRHGGGPVAGPAPGHGRAVRRHHGAGRGRGRRGPALLGRPRPQGDGRACSPAAASGARRAAVAPRPWRPGPAAAGPRCSGCRTPSPPWRAAPSPSSPPCTATASAAASTSSPPATSGWPRRTPSSRSARPRWPSWPTSAACSGCPPSSAPGTWPSWPSPARTSAPSGPRRSAW